MRIEAAACQGRPVLFKHWAVDSSSPVGTCFGGRSYLRVGSCVCYRHACGRWIPGVEESPKRLGRQARCLSTGGVHVRLCFRSDSCLAAPRSGDSRGWDIVFCCARCFSVRGCFLAVYMAFEPYVRRRSPRTLISWTRLLAGRFRDPLVGADLLVGCVLASALLCVDALWYHP